MQRDQFIVHARAETEHWWFRARRRILLEIIRQLLPPDPERLVIDVGCGTGGNAAALAEHYRCVGIDTSVEAIAIARDQYPQVEFRLGLAPRDLDGMAREADLFLLSDVLEHIPDDFRALSELVAAARPGAYLVLTVPADASLWSRHDESHGHFRRYDRPRLERLWRDLPVTPLLVSAMNTRLYPVIRAVRTVNRWLGRSAGEADTDVRMPTGLVNQFLEHTFAGERFRLRASLHAAIHDRVSSVRCRPRRGVSLMAVLRRETGTVVPCDRPSDVEPDEHYR